MPRTSSFIPQLGSGVIGVSAGFDRLRFRGPRRVSPASGLERVADLHRRAEVFQAKKERYAQALESASCTKAQQCPASCDRCAATV